MKLICLASSMVVVAMSSGCLSLGGSSSKAEDPVTIKSHQESTPTSAALQSAPKPQADYVKKDDEIYLQQARIMSRMSEIESELKQQREKIRLLEQGLLTGIAPDELKTSHDPGRQKRSSERIQNSENLALPKPNLDSVAVFANKSQDEKTNDKSQDLDQKNATVEAKLKLVENLYQASRFGVAITELAALSREYGEDSADGKIRFWLGKSYSKLNELTTARSEFEAYVKGWPSSPHIAEVRLELSRVYTRLGLKERARRELQRVMKDFSGQEPSEIASSEFNKLQGGL